MNPLATWRALCLAIIPFRLYLTLYTHLETTGQMLGGEISIYEFWAIRPPSLHLELFSKQDLTRLHDDF